MVKFLGIKTPGKAARNVQVTAHKEMIILCHVIKGGQGLRYYRHSCRQLYGNSFARLITTQLRQEMIFMHGILSWKPIAHKAKKVICGTPFSSYF
jgi:hypothetical protein